MAAYTRKQIVTCVSIIYLILVTALAGYATSRTNRLSLPIPNALSGFATLLPIVSGLLLEAGYDMNRFQERRNGLPKGSTPRPLGVVIANTVIFIYSTVIITLLGTHAAPPSGLDCGLKQRWMTMFRKKDSPSIRTIQDAFNCCGFANPRDMAWPFVDKSHDQHACERAFGRTSGCFGEWKGEEQRMAGLLMGIVGLVFVWQIIIIATPTRRESWLHRVVPDRISRIIADEEQGDGRARRAIDYSPNFDRYRDNVAEEVSDDDRDGTPQRAIEGDVQQIRNVFSGGNGGGQEQEQPPYTVENEWNRN